MLNSTLKAIFLFVLNVVVVTIFGTIFVSVGWNYGVVPAIQGTNMIHLTTAGWLSLFISATASYFKFSIKAE